MRFRRLLFVFTALFALTGCGINPEDYESSSRSYSSSERSSSSSRTSSTSSEHHHSYFEYSHTTSGGGTRDDVTVYKCRDCNAGYYEFDTYKGYQISYGIDDWSDPSSEAYVYAFYLYIPSLFNGTVVIDKTFNGRNVTVIRDNPFNSPYIKSIEIPSTVKEIGQNAFNGCYNLESIVVDGANPYYSSSDSILFNKDRSTLIRFPAKHYRSTYYSIPSTVETIAENAFRESNVEQVYFSNGIVSIGDYAFANCSRLRELDLFGCSSVNFIGNNAFQYCYNLMRVKLNGYLGDGDIGQSAFEGCYKLIEVYNIANRITDLAPGDDKCGRLASNAKWVYTSNSDPSNLHNNGSYFYYDEYEYRYVVGRYTTNVSSEMSFSDDYHYVIYNYAFYKDNYLGVINLSEVEQILSYAFAGTKIVDAYFPSSISYVGYGAFNECNYLRSVSFDSLSALNNISFSNPFTNCYHLVLINLSSQEVVPSSYFYDSSIYGGLFSYIKAANTALADPYYFYVEDYGVFLTDGTKYDLARVNNPGAYSGQSLSFYRSIDHILPYAFYSGSHSEDTYGAVHFFSTSINQIDQNAFKEACIRELIVDSDIAFIDSSAFEEAKIDYCRFDSVINTLYSFAFKYSCILHLWFNNIAFIRSNAFSYINECRVLHLEYVNYTYIEDELFAFSTIGEIRLPENLPEITDELFKNSYIISRLIIPTSVTSIEDDSLKKSNYIFYLGSSKNAALTNYKENGVSASKTIFCYSEDEKTTMNTYWYYLDEEHPVLWCYSNIYFYN